MNEETSEQNKTPAKPQKFSPFSMNPNDLTNIQRKSSEYVYQIQETQLAELSALALARDQTLENLVWEALDQYIKKEETSCQEQ